MSTARIFDFAEYVEPATDPHGIPPVAAEVPVDSRSSRNMWESVCGVGQRAKKLTKPTRIGRRVYRKQHQKAMADPHGDFLADQYMEMVRASTGEDKQVALAIYFKQIARNNRRFLFRWLVIHWWNVAIVGGEVYALFTIPAWVQIGLTAVVAGLIVRRWNVRGKRVMKARRYMLAKRRGTLQPVANLQFDQPELKVLAEPFNSFNSEKGCSNIPDFIPEAVEDQVEVEQTAKDPRYRLLYDILEVATPTAGQILDDPLSEFVIQTDPLVELLRKHSAEYKSLDNGELRKKLSKFGLRVHQKNLPTTWDGKRPNRTGWHFAEINDVIERGSQWES
jgi:hypothetical protein